MNHTLVLLNKSLPQESDHKCLSKQFVFVVTAIATLLVNYANADWRGIKPMTQDECDQHLRQLELTESQTLEAKQLFLTYQLERREVDAALKKVGAWSVNHQVFGDSADIKDIILEANATSDSAYEQWDVIIRDLEDRYFAGLKVLVPEKEELLASIRRARVRLSMLDDEHISRAWCYGAHLDLISELEGIATDNEVISEILLEYEYSMQSELKHFANAITLSESDGTLAVESMKNAVEQFGVEGAKAEINALAMKSAQIGLSLSRIRSLNERTIQKLLSILPTEDSEQFRNKIYPVLYPFAYKDLKLIGLYRRAVKLKDLTEEQREVIERLRDDFLIRRDQELASLAAIYRQSVGKDSILTRYHRQVMRRATRGQYLIQASVETLAFESAIEEWRAIEAQYTTRINSMLTTKQRNRVK